MSSTKLVCLDASTVIAFVFPDEPLHAQAKALLKAFDTQGVKYHVPAIFAYECDSVIRLRVYKKTLTSAQAKIARLVIQKLSIDVEYDASVCDRAYEIANEYDQPRAYDAAYAAHAEVHGLELVTADEPFFEAINGSKCPKTATPLTFVKLLA